MEVTAARWPYRSARAWTQLVAGLLGFAAAVSLMIRSGLGLGPWDAFHLGLHEQTGISIGTASIAAGLVIVGGSWFIGIRPGPGTIANMILVGLFIDLVLPLVPSATGLSWGLAYYAVAILVCGLATGFYLGARLGAGPRDGLMMGLARRSGWPVRRVRTLMEVFVLLVGWWMGGVVGLGTLLFAFGIGPATQWGLWVCGVDEARRGEAAHTGVNAIDAAQ